MFCPLVSQRYHIQHPFVDQFLPASSRSIFSMKKNSITLSQTLLQYLPQSSPPVSEHHNSRYIVLPHHSPEITQYQVDLNEETNELGTYLACVQYLPCEAMYALAFPEILQQTVKYHNSDISYWISTHINPRCIDVVRTFITINQRQLNT